MVKAIIPEEQCQYLVGTTLYSEISYSIGDITVKYYSNKLPRLAQEQFAEPEVTVHGIVQSQVASVDQYLKKKAGTLDELRNVILKNVRSNVKDIESYGEIGGGRVLHAFLTELFLPQHVKFTVFLREMRRHIISRIGMFL